MKFLIMATAVTAALFASACSGNESTPTVRVSGSAKLRQQPDRVSFSVGVETVAATVTDAYQTVNSKLNTVAGALKARGVKDTDIQTSNFSITSRDEEGKPLRGFRVSNLVTVTQDARGDLSGLIQAAVAAGANQAGGLRFFLADPKPLQDRGIELAFQDARSKAQKLAALSGRMLGDVVSIDEGWAGEYGGVPGTTVTVAALESPSIEIGTEELEFAVNVVFKMK